MNNKFITMILNSPEGLNLLDLLHFINKVKHANVRIIQNVTPITPSIGLVAWEGDPNISDDELRDLITS